MMKIQEMFLKPIDRRINGVIKVGQNQEEDKKQELEEYVVTAELKKHFQRFFANYVKSIDQPMDEMGVWISGFFGSGKSHFLKILSYILDEPEVDGKKAMAYLTAKDAIASDPTLVSNMERAAATPTLTVLFNVDSKSTSTAKSDSNAIVTVFNRVFNERLGYEGSIPLLAELERTLDEEGKFQLFQDTYQQVNGVNWLDDRHKFRVHRSWVEKTLVAMGYMDEDAAKNWSKEASTQNAKLSISDFAEQVHRYIERTGKRVVFLVDEIGQFISTDSHLMLNLQTLTEELGTKCQGKAWVIVTAQEAIDDMTANIGNAQERKNDFSKIQGRFNTRLTLSSVNADEVIRERILKKNPKGHDTLTALYGAEETTIQNVVDFRDTPHEMKKYQNGEEFAAVYPFLPYQFYLLADVFTSIRKNSSSGRSLSTGERSILGAFQQAAVSIMREEEGALVPFYRFYDNVDQVIDHTHKIVIERAIQNPKINPNGDTDCFAVNVLKVLFLLKYVDGIPLNENNLVNFMVTQIHEDKASLRRKVREALQLLHANLYIAQKQDTYTFLTDDEQDMDRAIRSRNISQADVVAEISNVVFNGIYDQTRFKVSKGRGQYTYGFNKAVDSRPFGSSQNNDLGLRILTPYYDQRDTNDAMAVSFLSGQNQEAILVLPSNQNDYYLEMQQAMQIEDYLRKVADPQQGKSTMLRTIKQSEAVQRREAAEKALREAIGNAEVYVNGNLVSTIKTHDPVARIQEALTILLDTVYYHLKDITAPREEENIKELFQKQKQGTSLFGTEAEEVPNANALEAVKTKVEEKTQGFDAVSLRNLMDIFREAPYGYSDTDTKWLAAVLFLKGDLSARIDKEPINRFEAAPGDLFNYFTAKRNEERLLFRLKATIKPRELKAAKDIIKEFFNYTEPSEDPDRIMGNIKDHVRNLLQVLDKKANKVYWKYPQSPGKLVLEQVKRQWNSFLEISQPEAFFATLAKKEDELLDLAEDLQPVQSFLDNASQQKIFVESGLTPLHLYQENKDHLLDAPLVKELAKQIRDIVTNPTPYRNIKDLPALNDSFRDAYMKVLEPIGKEVEEAIEADAHTVQDALQGKEYAGKYETQAVWTFEELKESAGRENNISKLLGYRERSASQCRHFLDTFDREDATLARKEAEKPKPQGETPSAAPDVPPATPVKEKKVKTLLARDLMPQSVVILREEKDIDDYLAKLRQKLEEALKNADEIKLR